MRRRIREYDLKKMFYNYFGEKYEGLAISNLDDLTNLDKNKRYVVKVDEMFNKRNKMGLVGLNLSYDEVKEFIYKNYGKNVNGGVIKHFLVEPYIEHQQEYYLAIISEREGDRLLYSDKGGVDIEESWNFVKEEWIPYGQISKIHPNIHKFFIDLEFTYLEINPYCIVDNKIIPLGMLGELDDYASFKNKWKIDFPEPFEKGESEEEKIIEQMDKNSGASFKLTILNPQGRIWLMTAGGGASVVFLDSIYLHGYGNEIANYAEYSGNPTTNETYEYARVFFKAMFKSNSKPKILVLGGGIANFTDVSKTFDGIIKAIKEYQKQFIEHNVYVIVRRGGPNAQIALEKIRKELNNLNIAVEVYNEDYNIDEIGAKIGNYLNIFQK